MGGLQTKSNASFDVLVTTPEALRMLQGFSGSAYQLKHFGLVIFDECHHVSKKHPYRKLARILALLGTERPQILGLTASVTYGVSSTQIEGDIKTLCEELKIELICTSTRKELQEGGYHGATPDVVYSPAEIISPTESTELSTSRIRDSFFTACSESKTSSTCINLLGVVRSLEKEILTLDPRFQSPIDQIGKPGRIQEWSAYALQRSQGAYSKQLAECYCLLQHWYESLRLLVISHRCRANPNPQPAEEIAITYLHMTCTDKILKLNEFLSSACAQSVQDFWKTPILTPRLDNLVTTLLAQKKTHGDKFRGIVFVQHRLVTHILEFFLHNHPDLTFLRCQCVYATSTKASPQFRVSKQECKLRIAMFADGRCNLLISTAVSEEGMDIPASNCIIRFDHIQTPVSLVQSRGRARQAESTFVYLAEDKEKPVSILQQAEENQVKILKSFDLKKIDQNREKQILHAKIQRETIAKKFVQEKKNDNYTATFNIYAQKSACEVIDKYEKKNGGFECVLVIMGQNNTREMRGWGTSKKIAKNIACEEFLKKYILSK